MNVRHASRCHEGMLPRQYAETFSSHSPGSQYHRAHKLSPRHLLVPKIDRTQLILFFIQRRVARYSLSACTREGTCSYGSRPETIDKHHVHCKARCAWGLDPTALLQMLTTPCETGPHPTHPQPQASGFSTTWPMQGSVPSALHR